MHLQGMFEIVAKAARFCWIVLLNERLAITARSRRNKDVLYVFGWKIVPSGEISPEKICSYAKYGAMI